MKIPYNTFVGLVAVIGLSACSFEPLPEDQYSDLNIEQGGFTEEVAVETTKKKTSKLAKKAKKKTFKDEQTFEVASVSDDVLSNTRGGFISVSGLKINFGLYTQTLVNNALSTSAAFSTTGLNGSMPSNLQQLVQTGNNNVAAVTSTSAPINVLTVVQNTADNQLIQNINVLDITVSNMAAFRNQQIGNNARFLTIGR